MNFYLDANAKRPERAHYTDAGLDLFISKFLDNNTLNNQVYILKPGHTCVLDTGVHVDIKDPCAGFVLPRSSISMLGIMTHTGVIDSGYTGSIKVVITNLNKYKKVKLYLGQKIAQLVIQPVMLPYLNQVSELPDTERGSDGFGSTGKF